ncbi:sporulation protein YunB [Caldanaerobius polysaccharolyticus]|uniref:sporulation protein YunB n=1 Tax=Caldanaerobius polysaccharolyticus TaxID=44256 RepID=UPI0004793EC3|nr:sporulation protein YunB [Caldanaerobius polysaccharolyticus]
MHHKHLKAHRSYIFFIVLLTIFICLYIIDKKIEPIVLALSEAQARILAVKSIDSAIYKNIVRDIDYSDLVYVRTDKDGKIAMVQSNVVEMNKIAAETSLEVQHQLDQIKSQKVYVPLGSLLSNQIFANFGPRLPVGILPVGTVEVNFRTQFDKAGINQTRHRIFLVVDGKIQIVAPLSSKIINVSTEVPIAENIIIGDVPNSYYDTTDDKLKIPVK